MSMTIGEASAVASVLKAVTGNVTIHDHERTQIALRFLNERAGKSLQLTRIVPPEQLDEATDELVPPAVTG